MSKPWPSSFQILINIEVEFRYWITHVSFIHIDPRRYLFSHLDQFISRAIVCIKLTLYVSIDLQKWKKKAFNNITSKTISIGKPLLSIPNVPIINILISFFFFFFKKKKKKKKLIVIQLRAAAWRGARRTVMIPGLPSDFARLGFNTIEIF